MSVETGTGEIGAGFLTAQPETDSYDAVIVAVGHRQFVETGISGVRAFGREGGVLFDVKGIYAKDESDGRL